MSGIFIYPGKVGGAENYFNNLLAGFLHWEANQTIDLIMNEHFKNDFAEEVSHFHTHYINVKYNRTLYDYILPYLAKGKGDYDAYFSPNYITPLPIFKNGKKYITTLHDLQYLHFPQFFSKIKRSWLYLAHLNMLKNSDTVVCISDFVRKDVIRFFGEKYTSKLKVIHNPINFEHLDKPALESKFKFDFPYILSVSAQYPHKNTLTLIKAFNIFNQKYPELKLVLTGQLSKNLRGGHYQEYGNQLEQAFSQNPNIIITNYVSEADLALLYNNCSFFIFPSLFEGFGMPTIEAMSLGKPTITTKRGSLQEVTMDRAIYMENPTNEQELFLLMEDCYNRLGFYKSRFESYKNEIREKYNPINISHQYLQLFD